MVMDDTLEKLELEIESAEFHMERIMEVPGDLTNKNEERYNEWGVRYHDAVLMWENLTGKTHSSRYRVEGTK
jgi:hypothetical protein